MSTAASGPADRRALVAIDLGAESCRVSLLRWVDGASEVELVHRFANRAVETSAGLRWPIADILEHLQTGLALAAERAGEGIRSIGVDGWAVDYVRLGEDGTALADPFCYRDERTVAAEATLHERISAEHMRALTGVQLHRINTVYQLASDPDEVREARWLNLPEYVLYRLGGRAVAEFSNATHTQMVGLDGRWCAAIFQALGMRVEDAPEIVASGTDVGQLRGLLAERGGFANTRLIAPCCHDTASAIASIPDGGNDWAYISSGTWSLVGTTLDAAVNSAAACEANFTNLGGADGKICFHRNVNGMWLLRQCLEHWSAQGVEVALPALIDAAQGFDAKPFVLEVDEADLMLPGNMPARINAQLRRRGLQEFREDPEHAAELASFLFHSLAARYAKVLGEVAELTGKRFSRLYILGGGSQNEFLNRLTGQATGLDVRRAGTEGSTMGNFAVQLAALEGGAVSRWARRLAERTP